MSVLGLKMSFSPYLRSAMVRFPLRAGELFLSSCTEQENVRCVSLL